MFEMTKNCNVFPRSLGVCKNQINLIWEATMQKFIKYFYFSCNSFFGTFILVFPFHGNIVLLFRENFVCLLCLFLRLKHSEHPYYPFFSYWNSYFCLLFQNFELYFIPSFFMEGTWKPVTTLLANSGDDKLINIFLIFPRIQVLTLYANCLYWRQICMQHQNLFSWKNKKKDFNFSSPENFTHSAKP